MRSLTKDLHLFAINLYNRLRFTHLMEVQKNNEMDYTPVSGFLEKFPTDLYTYMWFTKTWSGFTHISVVHQDKIFWFAHH